MLFFIAGCKPPVSDDSYSILDSTEPELDYNWIDISGTGTEVLLGDDDFSEPLFLPFSFEFFDNFSSWVHIHSNGFIVFTTSAASPEEGKYLPRQIPNTHDNLELIIAGLWADLDPSLGGHIYYQNLGERPERIFVIAYDTISYADASGSVTFQILLYEGSGIIELQYQDFETDGRRHTQGIEDFMSRRACFAEGRNFKNFLLPDEYAVRFFKP